MYQELIQKDKKIAVIGLGYVGLPLALVFAKKFKVIGFDINSKRIDMMKQGVDPSKELSSDDFLNKDIEFSSDPEKLKEAHFFIVAVPTPVDEHKIPDLKPVIGASHTVGKALKKGDYVIFESTVYPGCTEEDCLPILEEESGLQFGLDFKLGYSPERINPGDKERTVETILKIVSGSDAEALEEVAKVYGAIIQAGVYKASSIKVAEAAKVIENTQRDLNISFMNELSMIFDRMGIDTREVLAAAGTKWNFLKFEPGLVGGHCIGVDPYYLLHKSKELGYDPEVILSGRRINDNMPAFVAKKLAQMLIAKGKNPSSCRVLIQGITFKENVSDIRNSKVADLYNELADFSISVDVIDPYSDPEEVYHEYGIHPIMEVKEKYDAIIVAVAHNEFRKYQLEDYKQMMNSRPILIDLKGLFPKPTDDSFTYWRL
ncbi:MAG TPA: nucleotide sugar dehydrogenase [Saprospiraceae bacterium]|nr:nucleotide sugar dehydrogenase [Saprospiraceae bacterium]